MAYYWAKETNSYGRNVDAGHGASTATSYTRGGYLKRIEYGLRVRLVYSQRPPAKVDFAVAERCLRTAAPATRHHAKNWPDVPFDQNCKSGDKCKDRYSPSFWTRKRLTRSTRRC